MLAEILILAFVPALLVAAGVWDLTSFIIPNKLSLALSGLFLVFALVAGLSLPQLGFHLLAGLAGLALGFVIFALGWIGGGDAKLFAGVALWLGFSDLASYALYVSILGGLLTLGLLFARQCPLPAFLARQPWILRLHEENADIPYGVALAAGAFLVLPHTEIFRLAVTA